MFVIIYYTGITALDSAIINVINIIYIFNNNNALANLCCLYYIIIQSIYNNYYSVVY